VTPEQLQILQHSLGVDQYGQGKQYRNYFCAGEGTADYAVCRELVQMGYMWQGHRMNESDIIFHVHEQGKSAMRGHSPLPPTLTRSQQRYRDFLKSDSGLSFYEWLTYKSTPEGERVE
jgi:hypothetical protein